MPIIVSTNIQALKIQNSLSQATTSMNTAMTRMSTGYKINAAKDDAAGMAISTTLETKISGTKVASQNAQIGSNLLTTSEDTLNVMQANVQRMRDLIEQAANGTYDQTSKTAIRTEIMQRVNEINRLSTGTDFNGIKLFDTASTGTNGVALQVGTGSDSTTNVITLDKSLFTDATASALGLVATGGAGTALNDVLGNSDGLGTATGATLATAVTTLLNNCDTALTNISNRKTNIGAYQNRLTSAIDTLGVQKTNLSAANSTIKDADIATESAEYVKQQILQSASASLLASANSAPQIALQLIQGG